MIAARASEITRPDGRVFRFYTSVARPVRAAANSWICDLRIASPEHDTTHPLRGMDSLGAIESAFLLLRDEFRGILIRYGVVGHGSVLRNLADSELEAEQEASALPGSSGANAAPILIGERSLELTGVDGATAPLYVSLTKPVSPISGAWFCELRVHIGAADMTYPNHADNPVGCLALAMHQLHSEMRVLAPSWPDAAAIDWPD